MCSVLAMTNKTLIEKVGLKQASIWGIVKQMETSTLLLKWCLGQKILAQYITEFENKRNFAPYGSKLIKRLAAQIHKRTGILCSHSELYACIRFARKIDEMELPDIIKHYRSWYRVTHELLPKIGNAERNDNP